jgi:DNA-binding response OmpR family regulator
VSEDLQVKNKKLMLIVDDEIGILKVLKEIFEMRRWSVLTTPTGTSVLPILEKDKVDIVLLDIKLPDGSGLDVLKAVKTKFPKLPVVIFTALGYEDDLVNKAISLGAAGYVSKTVALTELIEVVNNILV